MDPGKASSYDEVPYGDSCFFDTHPDYLATLAGLHGLAPAGVDRCRVLELGCAGGGNLIPMALENPDARFVGVDLSPRQVAAGQAIVAELGLGNIDLRATDLTAIDDRFGPFDYIVCHGVFSWVPDAVRDAILAICRDRLTPHGIAYVSYNTYPGWHGRGMVREMLAYHVRRPAPALVRAERARGFLDELLQVLPDKSTAYARTLRNEDAFLRQVADSYLIHEHLDETNQPLYFHEFLSLAEAKGLRFVAEARSAGLVDGLPPDARVALERWADDRRAAEQYLDFLCNRTFRRTLLCHAHREPSPEASAAGVSSLWVSTRVVPASAEPDTQSAAVEEFRRPEDGSVVSTNNPVIKLALVILHEERPRAVAFDDLCARVIARLVPGLMGDGYDVRTALREALLRCFLSELVVLHTRPPRFAPAAGARPVASPLARVQARDAERVTTLRRRNADVKGFDRLVLLLLDGTRDRAALLDAMADQVASGAFAVVHGDEPVSDAAVIREVLAAELEPCLSRLAAMAMLQG